MTVIPFADGRHPMLRPRTHEVVLEDLELDADIGFHDFEVGVRQRLLATVRVRLDLAHWPQDDSREASWDYDFIRTRIQALVAAQRFNLQERLAEEIFALVAEKPGVIGLTVSLRKPDIYPDARSVGILLSTD